MEYAYEEETDSSDENDEFEDSVLSCTCYLVVFSISLIEIFVTELFC